MKHFNIKGFNSKGSHPGILKALEEELFDDDDSRKRLLREIYEAATGNWNEWLENRSSDWLDETKPLVSD